MACVPPKQWGLAGSSWTSPSLQRSSYGWQQHTDLGPAKRQCGENGPRYPEVGREHVNEWISKLAETTAAEKLIKCPSDNGIESWLMKLWILADRKAGPLWRMRRNFGSPYWLLQHTSQRKEKVKRDNKPWLQNALHDSLITIASLLTHGIPWPSQGPLVPFWDHLSWFLEIAVQLGERGVSLVPCDSK